MNDLAPAALTAPCPCDDGCRFRARCQARREACEAFSMYIHSEPENRWRLAPRAPTRSRFEALVGRA